MEKTIEIPEGYEARIEGNKIILEPKESEDERIRKALLNAFQESEDSLHMVLTPHRRESFIAWLEKQGNPKMSAEALREGIAHYGITQYQIDNWLKKYVEVESTEPKSSAWSEDDEEMLRRCISATFDHGYLKESDWLKSFKDRYTWKPSGEQLHYLSWVANIKLGNGVVEQEVSKHLNKLYDDLKKLKG